MYEDQFEIREEVFFDDFTGKILHPKKSRGFNSSITRENLLKIHPSQRNQWFRLDLSIFDIKIPVLPPKTAWGMLTETPPDLFKILKDKAIKRKLEE
jgi:hypothetical protein